ncbi:MAG: P-loop NTPase [Promethearchaeota archaeon]
MVKQIFQLGIISGKGGVGKTSISASIACALNESLKILAVDTDVDAPNLAILFQALGTSSSEFKVQTTEKARLIEDKCTHCKMCIDENFCHFNALSWNESRKIPEIDSIACEGCRACEILCPAHAFKIDPIDSGNISHLHSSYGFDVITGETILGSQTSGKLVTELKKYASQIASEKNSDIIIIDGPPGIGCPVIAAITDLNYCIVVIEPTTAALHDAKRVIQIVQDFKIPFSVIINKSDMYKTGYDQIIEYLGKEHIELLGEIPLDNKWPFAIAKGLPIYKDQPDGISANKIRTIASKLKTLIRK